MRLLQKNETYETGKRNGYRFFLFLEEHVKFTLYEPVLRSVT